MARIGSYVTDLVAGRWVSSSGLDAILGIDAAFDRSVAGWASLVHPDERAAMLAYLTEDVAARGEPFDRQYRIIRADSGEERWVHGRGRVELDPSGRPIRSIGTIADITEQHRAQEALARSERRYAAIFEGTTEAILIAEQATLRFRYVNAAASMLLGYTPDELTRLTVRDIHPAEALPAILAEFEALSSGAGVSRSVPCVRRDGRVVLADIKASPVEIDGVPCLVGFFSDVTDLRHLEAHDRKLAQAIEQASEAILITDPVAVIEYANPAFERLSGQRRDALVGRRPNTLGSPQSRGVLGAMERALAAGATWQGDLIHRRPQGDERVAEVSISPVRGGDGAVTGYVAVERDVTAERALQAERERLVAAIEHTSESVIIADLTGTIEYVNPAFERVSGYRREEVIGQNPRILKSGRQTAGFYRALWARLTRGRTWSGTMINRRKDGTLYEEEATISPIRGPDGAITSYVGVQRDVTAIRATESVLAAEFRERAQVAASLARLQPAPTAAGTAAEICGELLGLPGIDVAAIFDFPTPGRAVCLAAGGPDGLPFSPGRPLPFARAEYLYGRAEQGPWAEVWRGRPEDGSYGAAMAALGIKAIAGAPIRNGDGLLGLVSAATFDDEYARHLIDHLPAVGEFAATASALLSGQLEWSHRSDLVTARIRQVLADRAFRPVFQPIFALASGEPVGYEALTRFADGTPPDRVIAEAHVAGLGSELEFATLAAALEAAATLPRDYWLSLNVSPDVILRAELGGLLAGRARRIVLEVTEHLEIADYRAVRRAVADLGPTVSLAVDDAGAGFASLRHVVELRPQFLKLDISLVRHVDRDLTRQAMVAGLTQFAQRARCEVIAEGIETRPELDMLRELGAPLGQGYFLGRPEPLPADAGR